MLSFFNAFEYCISFRYCFSKLSLVVVCCPKFVFRFCAGSDIVQCFTAKPPKFSMWLVCLASLFASSCLLHLIWFISFTCFIFICQFICFICNTVYHIINISIVKDHACCLWVFVLFQHAVFRKAIVAMFPEGLPPCETDVTTYVSGFLVVSISLHENLWSCSEILTAWYVFFNVSCRCYLILTELNENYSISWESMRIIVDC